MIGFLTAHKAIFSWSFSFLISLILAPMMPGIINQVKAFFAGRRGPSVFQLYFDLFKLLRKGSIYSTTTTDVLRITPIASLASLLAAAVFIPFAACPAPFPPSFPGDLILFLYFFAFGRFLTVLAALDTASSFEGMGASREVQFSSIAEPAFIAALATMAMLTGKLSLSEILIHENLNICLNHGASIFLLAAALFILLLSECCRVPFDDPNTHLELTMIHEAMILDYGGPDLAMILYASSLKMWLFGSLIVLTVLPFPGSFFSDLLLFPAAVLFIAVLVGIVESVMARFRFIKVPQMLFGALGLALLAMILKLVTLTGGKL